MSRVTLGPPTIVRSLGNLLAASVILLGRPLALLLDRLLSRSRFISRATARPTVVVSDRLHLSPAELAHFLGRRSLGRLLPRARDTALEMDGTDKTNQNI